MQNSLRFTTAQVVWQEVPGEVSLAFTLSGCPLRCKGCHSAQARNPNLGELLLVEDFLARLGRYRHLITCVLFLGGEWQPEQLLVFLKIAREQHLQTCLYSGAEAVAPQLLPYLSYLKTGAWVAARGGLSNPNTNQRFIDLRSNELINYKFHTKPQTKPQTKNFI